MSKDERARAERARRKAKAAAALAARIEQIRVTEHKAGFDKGVQFGASMERGKVLEHAAVHYKAGRDVQAAAVRGVYRALSNHPVTLGDQPEEPKG